MTFSVKFGEKKFFDQDSRPPQPGAFAIEGGSLSWHSCREQFAHKFSESSRGLFLSHERDDEFSHRIACFMTNFEEVLDLPEPRTSYHLCNRKFATWVEPSNFWKKCYMRRSLLTILLRNSLYFRPEHNNFEEALYITPPGQRGDYAADTKLAIMRFMFGFTQYVGSNSVRGWWSAFRNLKEQQVRALLVRPSESPSDSSIIGFGSLWM